VTKHPWSDASPMGTRRSPPRTLKQASTEPAPCEREATRAGARLCRLQPSPVPRPVSSAGAQSQPCPPRRWQQLCRIRNPAGSRPGACVGRTGVPHPRHAGTSSTRRGGRPVPGTSVPRTLLDVPAGAEPAGSRVARLLFP